MDGTPAGTLLPVLQLVLSRWWGVGVANTYKKAAWRLALDPFATAQRMQLTAGCAACSVAGPGVEHRFWQCLVAVAVREEVESQVTALICFNVPQGLCRYMCTHAFAGSSCKVGSLKCRGGKVAKGFQRISMATAGS